MRLTETFFKEDEKKTAVAAFGRLNPPTTGHNAMVSELKKVPGDHFLFLSHSQGAKNPDAKPGTKAGENKDPLSFSEKLPLVKQAFPDVRVGSADVVKIFDMPVKLHKMGYTDLVIVAGSDRMSSYKSMFPKFNGVKAEHGYYKFNSIVFVELERDEESDGVEGMSASKLRQAVRDNDFESFKSGLIAGNPTELFKLLRDRLATDSIGLATQEEPVQEIFGGFATKTQRSKTIKKTVPKQDTALGQRVQDKLKQYRQDAKKQDARAYSAMREEQSNEITSADLEQLETYADKLFAKVGIDVEFTRHFLDRANDERNQKPITVAELTRLFKQEYKKWGKKIAQLGPDAQAVMKDMKTDINVPFVLSWDSNNQELDLVAKTVMRKDNFKTPNPEFAVESDLSLDRTALRDYIKSTILDYLEKEDDIGKLSQILKQLIGKTVRHQGSRFVVSNEDIIEACASSKKKFSEMELAVMEGGHSLEDLT